MRLAAIVLTLTAILVPSVGNAQKTQESACLRLWVERNTIFNDNGLCFTRPKAIEMFGNRNCIYDDARDMPMSKREEDRVKAIVALERELGCRRY